MSGDPSAVRLHVSTGETMLPVEIRDARLRLVERGLGRKDFLLPPAVYLVSVRPPGGDKLVETVDLSSGQERTVELQPDPDQFAPRPRYAKAERPAPRVRSLGSRAEAVPPDWSFRFLRLRGLSGAVNDPTPSARSVERQADGALSILIEVPEAAVSFVQIARPAEVPLNIALPAAAGGADPTCRLVARQIEGGLFAAAYPAGRVAALATQYLAAGDVREAAQVITGREAQDLLYGKVANPLGAAAGGYVLLRLGELERAHDWTDNLARWFEWLPDGAIIAGEKAARLGSHREALGWLLKVERRGLPVFTDGFSMLVSRLRQYRRNELLRREVEQHDVEAAAVLLSRLEGWSPFVDWSAPTLTFRAAAMSEPAGSQEALDDTSDFHAFDMDAQGRLVARAPTQV